MSEHRHAPQAQLNTDRRETDEPEAARESRPAQRRLSWCMAFASRLIDLEPSANPDALDEISDSQFEELCANGRTLCDPLAAADAFAQQHRRQH